MSPLPKGRMAAVATAFGIALAVFCAWQLHDLLETGTPHSRLHDLFFGGLLLGCLLAFPAVFLELWKAAAPYLPFTRKPTDGSN